MDINGPFADAEKQEKAFDAVSNPRDFNVSPYSFLLQSCYKEYRNHY